MVDHSPYHTAVTLSHKHLSAAFVAAYAPHKQGPQQERDEVFGRISACVARLRGQGWKVYVGIDANANIGSVVSPSVGAHHAQLQCNNGLKLHELVVSADLALPQTFSASMIGAGQTWFSSHGGSGRRLDYVAIPVQALAGATAAVSKDIDLMNPVEDHAPVIVTAAVARKCSRPPCARRLVGYDKFLFADPQRMASFEAEVEALPLQPFGMDADSHNHIVVA